MKVEGKRSMVMPPPVPIRFYAFMHGVLSERAPLRGVVCGVSGAMGKKAVKRTAGG